MTLYVSVWNMEGAYSALDKRESKWDIMYANWFYWQQNVGVPQTFNPTQPAVALPQGRRFALFVEAGWPPWLGGRTVTENHIYPFNPLDGAFIEKCTQQSALCRDLDSSRNLRTWWVPWVQDPDASTNSRCSFGGLRFGQGMQVGLRARDIMRSLPIQAKYKDERPYIEVIASNVSFPEPFFVLAVGHLISGRQWAAKDRLAWLEDQIEQLHKGSASGTRRDVPPTLIVGDLNIDITGRSTKVLTDEQPVGWSVARTGQPTHLAGDGTTRELDWGLLFDPSQTFRASAVQLARYKAAPNQSDHSVIGYAIDGPGL